MIHNADGSVYVSRSREDQGLIGAICEVLLAKITYNLILKNTRVMQNHFCL